MAMSEFRVSISYPIWLRALLAAALLLVRVGNALGLRLSDRSGLAITKWFGDMAARNARIT